MSRTLEGVSRNDDQAEFLSTLPTELVGIFDRALREHVKCTHRLNYFVTELCKSIVEELCIFLIDLKITGIVDNLLDSKLHDG